MATLPGDPDPFTGPVEEPMPGMDPTEPIPDDPGELEEPGLLPPPPVEATPDDPGGDPGEEPALT